MKFIFSCFLLLTVVTATAQHCPFDGYSVITVRFKEPLPTGARVFLKQIPLAETDSCKYGSRPVNKSFLWNTDSAFNSHSEITAEWFKKRLRNELDFTEGRWCVYLGDAETYCIKSGKENPNNYEYIPKSYRVVVEQDGKEIKSVPVPKDRVYKMCSTAGSWERIRSVMIE